MTDTTKQQDTQKEESHVAAKAEKHRRELWLYLVVAIAAVEFFITASAVVYGFMASSKSPDAAFAFPWLLWGALSVCVPAVLLISVHSANVGLFREPAGSAEEREEWQRNLPERLQKVYRFMKGAPAVVLLVGLVLLGAAMLTLDGALSALGSFGSALMPYLPHIIIGIATVICVIVLAMVWLRYRNNKLIAEYNFRREVLEKTGMVIVDKNSVALPPSSDGPVLQAIASSASQGQAALPAAEEIEDAVTVDVSPSDEPNK